jgi:hypothetical protein
MSKSYIFSRFHRKALLKEITNAITDLHKNDCGAINIWESSDGTTLVDIEWADGVSAFNLAEVLSLIRKQGKVTKHELVEYCL